MDESKKVSFICSECGQERAGVRRRCYVCRPTKPPPPEANERTRLRMAAVHAARSPEEKTARGRAMRAAMRSQFDLAAHMRTRPHPFAKPVGYLRVANGHMQIKCEDGKFRYRARAVWAAANGPLTSSQLIHHKNGNPFDDRLENLELLSRAEHIRIHSTPERLRAAQLLGAASRRRKRLAG